MYKFISLVNNIQKLRASIHELEVWKSHFKMPLTFLTGYYVCNCSDLSLAQKRLNRKRSIQVYLSIIGFSNSNQCYIFC